jgi:hypothetical protein
VLTAFQLKAAFASVALLCAYESTTMGPWNRLVSRSRRRTHVTTTEPLDRTYTPAFRLSAGYERYFTPTMVTDVMGRLTADVAEAAAPARRVRAAATSPVPVGS